MTNFAYITEDPEYDEVFNSEDADWEDAVEQDPVISAAVFGRIVEELSPFGTVNS